MLGPYLKVRVWSSGTEMPPMGLERRLYSSLTCNSNSVGNSYGQQCSWQRARQGGGSNNATCRLPSDGPTFSTFTPSESLDTLR